MSAERTCPICWNPFAPNQPRHTYCSARCRKTAYQRRHQDHPTETAIATHPTVNRPEPAPVALRNCPRCGETITIIALITTPEAARPNLPSNPTDSVIPLRRTGR